MEARGGGTEARRRGREVAARTDQKRGGGSSRVLEGGSWARKGWRHMAPEGGGTSVVDGGGEGGAQSAGVRGRGWQVLRRKAP